MTDCGFPAGWTATGIAAVHGSAASRQAQKLRRKSYTKSQRSPPPPAVPPADKGPGLLQQLLDLFRGKQDKAKPIDREPYRERLADALLAIRQNRATDAASRLGVLRALTPTLEAVFTEWTTAGERDAAVRELGEVVVALHAGDRRATSDAAVSATCGLRTEAVLQGCLTLVWGLCGIGAAWEGFWK